MPTYSLDDLCRNLPIAFQLFGKLLCTCLAFIVVDGQVASFLSKLFGDERAQASARLQVQMRIYRNRSNYADSTDLDPPVTSTRRPFKL